MLNSFGEVFENASLLNYNTYGINTSCKYLVKPYDVNRLKNLVVYLKENKIKFYILGKGSNVILPDTKFDGVIISLEKLANIEYNANIVTAECGVILGNLVLDTINRNLMGLEYLALIPGSLGGALYGNAGVKEHEIYDHIEKVLVLRNNELMELKKEDIVISYRYTAFKDNEDIIISATFKLEYTENITELKELIKESRIKRLETQPLEYKNAGSVFRNPEGTYAGKLIEEVGLKGHSIGGAEVSLKHANFIINKGNATSKDIIDLINLIKKKVKEEYNIDLKLEQIIVEWD